MTCVFNVSTYIAQNLTINPFSFLSSCYFRNRCVGVETSLRVHNFVYTVQPVPIVGRVDLAAVFLDAVKFKQEQLFFSKLHIFFFD